MEKQRILPPPVGYYFSVNFLGLLTADLSADMRFQSVSGFSVSMSPDTITEGGQNLYSHRLPTRFSYGNLILKRGLAVGSALNLQFQEAMTFYKFSPANVLVTLLNEEDIPVNAWLFINAYPVQWSSSDLDANEGKIVIETLELAYTCFQRMTL
jgi:phage tail-like protein